MVLGKHPLVPNPTQPCTPAQPIIWEVWAGIGAFVSTQSPPGDGLVLGSVPPP